MSIKNSFHWTLTHLRFVLDYAYLKSRGSILTFLFQSTQTILKEYREQCNNLLNGHSAESSGGRKKDIALIITGRTMKFVFKPSTRIGIPNSQFLCLTIRVDHPRNPLQEKILCFYH